MGNSTILRTEEHPILHRSIFFFYEQGLKYVPVVLMLCHWCGTFSFHNNPREIIIDIKENETCIIFLYAMAYIFPLVFMLPASYFFRHCWIWRIPFIYIMGINAIRLYYGSFLVTNEMEDADFIIIILTIILYIYGIIKILCRSFFKP